MQNEKNMGQKSVIEMTAELEDRAEDLRRVADKMSRNGRNPKSGRFAVYGF